LRKIRVNTELCCSQCLLVTVNQWESVAGPVRGKTTE
jgi:hypothetical protein